ncbi:MAG: c-type cytochrome [Acetobacteraceae bacterium]|nr:c-type cytochrome [Acetobacteraceae bacterium]
MPLPACFAARAADPQLERGQYLVERTSMCWECHSPRDQTGQFIRGAWLGGAPIAVVPKQPIPGWAEYAPKLAGLPEHYTEAQFVSFLETGLRPDGSEAGPPMPAYRFNQADAQAITAYLKSLRRE